MELMEGQSKNDAEDHEDATANRRDIFMIRIWSSLIGYNKLPQTSHGSESTERNDTVRFSVK